MGFCNPEKVIRQIGIFDGMTVADFGAGPGFYTFLASDLVKDDGVVYALDIQKDLLSRIMAEAKGEGRENIKTLHADLDEEKGSTLPSSSVDVVLATNIFFQVEKRDLFLKEAYRVLKNKGRLALVDWSESFGGLGPQPQDVISRARAEELSLRAGFIHDRDIEAGDHHYGIVFKKLL
ncbi:MAG: methyltransferase domain-containing protein [Candidatus Paceibacterota bacterium]